MKWKTDFYERGRYYQLAGVHLFIDIRTPRKYTLCFEPSPGTIKDLYPPFKTLKAAKAVYMMIKDDYV